MKLLFPKTYTDLKNAPYVSFFEIGNSGVFIYIKETFLPNFDEKTAYGKNLKEALQMLKNDFWKEIKKQEVNK